MHSLVGHIRSSNRRRLEVHCQDTIAGDLGNERLELGVSLAVMVVVLHVVQASELGLGDEGVALGAGILLSGTNDHRENVGLAVLSTGQPGSCSEAPNWDRSDVVDHRCTRGSCVSQLDERSFWNGMGWHFEVPTFC